MAPLLRAIPAGEHPRIHPAVPVTTLGPGDELTVLRAYESGSDHHLTTDPGYLLLARSLHRSQDGRSRVTMRNLRVGQIHADLAARRVQVAARSCGSAAWH